MRSFQKLTFYVKYKIYKKEESREGEPGVWTRTDKVETDAAGAEYRIKYTCYYKYCSKYTGKASRNITVIKKADETEEKEIADDSGTPEE